MKRFKKILFSLLAVVMVLGACLSFTACEDIKRLEVTVSVYDADENAMVDKTLTVDLYRHLAPTTVDHIIKNCVENDYYDNAILYLYNDDVMMGDIIYNSSADAFIKKSPLAPTVKGEFEYGGTTGSNLKVKEGSLALWRTYSMNDSMITNAGFDTGRATWYMPTNTLASLDGYITVFGQFDKTSEAWVAIKDILNNSSLGVEYTVYYTEKDGGYDANKADYNLDFHCVKTAELDDEFGEDDYFIPEENSSELKEFEKRTIKIPYATIGSDNVQLALKVKSVKLA